MVFNVGQRMIFLSCFTVVVNSLSSSGFFLNPPAETDIIILCGKKAERGAEF